MKAKLTIAIDFDGTCVAYGFPDVGADIGAAPVLRELDAAGHELIIWTVRSGEFLQPVLDWFDDNGISYCGINENIDQKGWSSSPKAYANIYIDDSNACMPLIFDPAISRKPYVDWKAVREWLVNKGVLE